MPSHNVKHLFAIGCREGCACWLPSHQEDGSLCVKTDFQRYFAPKNVCEEASCTRQTTECVWTLYLFLLLFQLVKNLIRKGTRQGPAFLQIQRLNHIVINNSTKATTTNISQFFTCIKGDTEGCGKLCPGVCQHSNFPVRTLCLTPGPHHKCIVHAHGSYNLCSSITKSRVVLDIPRQMGLGAPCLLMFDNISFRKQPRKEQIGLLNM